ncbi:PPE family protein [Lasiodiplodia theobromae]|uniref:PPE family protein n=1 Tax=Lasiodiplodia theobromae TaxID=45133 RepID=UPI0015C2DE67|nr:PPE family protein [Lasiodiplodia theobromae]KAF4541751.1 PPE family protein [Lasiodiplodia theobromae]
MKEPDRAQDIQEASTPHATSEPHITPNAMPHVQDGPTATELSVRLKTSGKDNMNNIGDIPVGAASQAHMADRRAAQGETTAAAPDIVKDNSRPKAATKKSRLQRAPIKLCNGRRFLFRDPSSAATSSSATRGSSTGAAPSAVTASSLATAPSTATPSSTATATPQAKEPRPLPEVSRAPSATVSVTVMDKHPEQVDEEIPLHGFDVNVAEAKACVQCLVFAVRKYGVDPTVETIEVFTGSNELLNSLTKFHANPSESADLKEQLQQVCEFVEVLKKLGKRVVFTCVKDHDGGDVGVEGKSKADDEVTVRDGDMKGEKMVSLKRKKGEDEGDGNGGRKKTKSQP